MPFTKENLIMLYAPSNTTPISKTEEELAASTSTLALAHNEDDITLDEALNHS